MDTKQRGGAVRYLIAGSVLVITVALVITLYIASLVARNGIVQSTQAANIALTQVFVNEVWPALRADYSVLAELPAPRLVEAPQIAGFDAAVRRFGQATDVLKIKIYDLHGHTIYSSDKRQIGQPMVQNLGFQSAVRGVPASELTYRGQFGAFDGAVHSRNLVSSYLPIRDDRQRVEAVVEIYTDRTGAIAGANRSMWMLATVLVPLFYAANGLLIYLVRRVDRIRQAQHDQLDRQSRELKTLAEENQAARIAAEAADRAKSDFLANVSHEIRTPMNAIVGFSHLALNGPVTGQPREYFQKISDSAQLLLRIINDILDFSKIEAGQLTIEDIEFSLEEVLAQVVAVTEGRARERGLTFAVLVAPAVPHRLRGDPLRLSQVLTNLVSNAVKFTPEGEVSLTVDVAAEADQAITLHIAVRDTGIGLSQEEVARLFRPFVQADSSTTRRFGGTGLGLAICKRLVDMMGGEIDLRSAPGAGTVASVRIPFGCCASASAGVIDVAPASPRPAGVTGSQPAPTDLAGLRVLLAEDNLINQQVARELMEAWGVCVRVVANGAEALQCLAESAFDLVLMDAQMPVMDGYEATRRIRADRALAGLPVIAMTAHATSGALERCRQAGMNDCVVKPIAPLHLRAVIAHWGAGAVTPDDAGLGALQPEIDLEVALRNTNGNRGTLVRALAHFRDESASVAADLRWLATARAFEELQGLAHSLKGSAATIGMSGVADAARALEAALAEDPDGLPAADRLASTVEGLAGQVERVMARLQDWTVPSGNEDAVSAGARAATPLPADARALQAGLRRAGELLAGGDAAALDALDALAREVGDGPLASDFRRVRTHAASFDFDAALLAAQDLLARLAVTPATTPAAVPAATQEARSDPFRISDRRERAQP